MLKLEGDDQKEKIGKVCFNRGGARVGLLCSSYVWLVLVRSWMDNRCR